MSEWIHLVTLELSAIGFTILIVWPQTGPSAWLRDQVIRRALPGSAAAVLDCYICLSFWAGLFLGAAWWYATGAAWCWAACLMTPGLMWLALRQSPSQEEAT